jgi:hypothetical protein
MSDGVIQLKQEPVVVCACEGRSWYLVCEPAGAEPDHIIAFECAHCRSRIQCDVRLREAAD